ncbi:hypothetical protein SAMN05216199_1227 [Pedococcus cremeus]|uniref:Lipoprotein n=1 Tax=Pedococcus cremeus TaxID=587636 RepID=A0A1H9S273_9MICO|nr:hypothetical protein [Pedococcus cremeus]SER79028.1 hypothetical protein SAMN05216199_1227 [Pedococcus cremeus]
MGQVTVRRVLLGAAVVLLLGACAAGTNAAESHSGAGFWLGLWQGMIIPVTFVISLFNDNVSIYEVHNNGNWYDFGFVLGLTFPYGAAGGGAARRR